MSDSIGIAPVAKEGRAQARFAYPDAWKLGTALGREVEKLDLRPNVLQLEREGYTIVDQAYEPGFCDRLRRAIKDEAARQQGAYFDIKAGEGISAYHLFGKNDLYAEALLNPKVMAIVEYLCGADFQLSQLSGSVRYQGAAAMALHIDAQWVPPTDYNPMVTVCLALDDLVEGSGATRVIPGSHLLQRNPDEEEAMACGEGVAMLTGKGGFSVWPGFTWHANFARTLPGERVMLHMTFCRLAYRPVEDYSHVSDDYLAKFPPALATMLGRHSWFGLASRNSGQCAMEHYQRTWDAARG